MKGKKVESRSTKILVGAVFLMIVAVLLVSFLVIQKGSSEVVSKEVKEKLRKDEIARVLVKTSGPVGVTSSEDLKKNYLFLDSNKNIEIKQKAGEYYSLEIDSKSLDEVLEKISVDKVIMDDTFEIFTEESMEIISVNEIHNLGYTGKGVKICVIDTGVNWEVLDLQYGGNVFGYNSIDDSEDIMDENGHGTKVMSVLSSVAPDADFYVVKAIGNNGEGYASDVGAAIEWCVSKNVDLISMSIGTGNFKGFCENDFVAGIVNDVVYEGTPVFAATGNDGDNLVSSPACSGLATPVASSNKLDEISIFSDYNENVFVVAPGEEISVINQLGQIVESQGTSLSTSFVAGIAALHFEKSRVIDPLSLETKIIRSGEVLEFEGKKFSRINAYNFLEDNLINDLSRSSYDYEDWTLYNLEENSVEGGDATFETLQVCESASDCTKQICIEGVCQEACNSTFDGASCSNDASAYDSTGGGVCAAKSGGEYSCDKDEVARTASGGTSYWDDCYEVISGAPLGAYQCDNDVGPGYADVGVCSTSTFPASTLSVNCDTEEVCVDSSNYYRSSCDYCGIGSEYECDSRVDDTGYTQDGVCSYFSEGADACETGAVCINSSGAYISSANIFDTCSDGDSCDSDVNPGFTADGLVCNTQSLGCVVNESRTIGQSCCEDANCATDNCNASNVCDTADAGCPSHPESFVSSSDAVFEIKNSTGQVCFAINDSGSFVITGNLYEACSYSSGGNVFEINVSGVLPVPVTINESCDFCAAGQVIAEDTSLTCPSGSFCVKNNSDTTLLRWANEVINFYGQGCYGYKDGSPSRVPTS